MTDTGIEESRAELAARWAQEDPDPDTATALRAVLSTNDTEALRDCFEPTLEFGTAGLRACVGPGPARMNLAVIRRVTRALAEVVERRSQRPDTAVVPNSAPMVVGFDGRIDSARFAREAVGVLAATDIPVVHFERPVPTPIVAFAAQRLGARAAIVVTASHNPPEYNGYKVYGADSIQIVPPFDREVTDALRHVGPANQIACSANAFADAVKEAHCLDASMGDAYVEAVQNARVRGARAEAIRIAYTPLHGVGASWVERVLHAAGYFDLHIEASQREIDGRFPTVRFPNPEEPQALERGLRLAESIGADLLLVNDPDADRLGAAIPARGGQFRVLSGNEIGCILTDYLLLHSQEPSAMAVCSTIVSTPMVERIAQHYGSHSEKTLTGFKWLWTAMRNLESVAQKNFAICWEEALGYSTHAAVRDKDGIAAALILADWVSECRSLGVSPIERLAGLYRTHGCWGSAPRNVVRSSAEGIGEIQRMMQTIVEAPPKELAGRRVTGIVDFSQGVEARPPWFGASEMYILQIDGGGRVVVRPSGTEPKLKCYADVEVELARGNDPLDAQAQAVSTATALNQALVERLEMLL